MEKNGAKKIVFEDNNAIKVIHGYIVHEDEFTYEIEALGTSDKVIIGKRAIVKISASLKGDAI